MSSKCRAGRGLARQKAENRNYFMMKPGSKECRKRHSRQWQAYDKLSSFDAAP
jgi:hypothetical protein